MEVAGRKYRIYRSPPVIMTITKVFYKILVKGINTEESEHIRVRKQTQQNI